MRVRFSIIRNRTGHRGYDGIVAYKRWKATFLIPWVSFIVLVFPVIQILFGLGDSWQRHLVASFRTVEFGCRRS